MNAHVTGSRKRIGLFDALLYLAVGLSPFLNLKNSAAFFTVSDGLFIICFLVILFRTGIDRSALGVVTGVWFLSYTLLVSGLFISSLMYGDTVRGLVISLQYTFCYVILPCIVLRGTVSDMYRLILVFLIGVVALDLHGIHAFYWSGYVPGSVVVTGGQRLATLNGNPNGAACLNAMTIVITLWLFTIGQIRILLASSFLIIMTIALVLTSSNTGLIAVAFGLTSYVLLTFRAKYVTSVAPILMVPVVFFYISGVDALPATFQKRVLPAVSSGDVSEAGTFADRRDLMYEAIDMIGARKVGALGIGADQFRLVSVQGIPVHNVFLITWVEGGITSLLGWMLLFAAGFRLWLSALARQVNTNGRSAVLSCFIIFAVFSNATPHIYSRFWYVILLLVMAPTIIVLKTPSGYSRR